MSDPPTSLSAQGVVRTFPRVIDAGSQACRRTTETSINSQHEGASAEPLSRPAPGVSIIGTRAASLLALRLPAGCAPNLRRCSSVSTWSMRFLLSLSHGCGNTARSPPRNGLHLLGLCRRQIQLLAQTFEVEEHGRRVYRRPADGGGCASPGASPARQRPCRTGNTRVSTVRPATLGFQARLAAAFSIKLAFIRRQRKQHVVLRQCVAGCRSGVLRQDRIGRETAAVSDLPRHQEAAQHRQCQHAS